MFINTCTFTGRASAEVIRVQQQAPLTNLTRQARSWTTEDFRNCNESSLPTIS